MSDRCAVADRGRRALAAAPGHRSARTTTAVCLHNLGSYGSCTPYAHQGLDLRGKPPSQTLAEFDVASRLTLAGVLRHLGTSMGADYAASRSDIGATPAV